MYACKREGGGGDNRVAKVAWQQAGLTSLDDGIKEFRYIKEI